MKALKYFLAALFLVSIGACDEYQDVRQREVEVVFQRPYEWDGRETGGVLLPQPFETGSRNYGMGPTIAYRIDLAQQQFNITVMAKTKDNVMQKFEVNFQYSLIKDAAIPLVLNFLPFDSLRTEDGKPYEVHSSNKLVKYLVSGDAVFAGYVETFGIMAINDVVGHFNNSDLNPDKLGESFRNKTIEYVTQFRIPRTVLNDKGEITFNENQDASQYISPIEVVNITGVTLSYERPQELKAISDSIEVMNTQYAALEQALQRTSIDRETKLNSARMIASINKYTSETYRNNPKLRAYRKLKELNQILTSGKCKNCEFYFVPKGSARTVLQKQ